MLFNCDNLLHLLRHTCLHHITGLIIITVCQQYGCSRAVSGCFNFANIKCHKILTCLDFIAFGYQNRKSVTIHAHGIQTDMQQNFCTVVQQNAASIEETAASIDEVAHLISAMAGRMDNLRQASDTLKEKASVFQL